MTKSLTGETLHSSYVGTGKMTRSVAYFHVKKDTLPSFCRLSLIQ